MTLTTHRISADVSTSAQLQPADMEAVAAAGFRSVVNNRPDHEGGAEQPTSAMIEAEAKAAGLAYGHLPVQPAVQTPEEATALAKLLVSLPKPVLMFCRSGARSAKLYGASQAL
ncbi:MAG: TIGR01244 family sulfur transferase [Caldimonas sp.]